MLNENAKKWVAALRSGEYKQTRGQLVNDEGTGHCCLGVACEVFLKEPCHTLNDSWRERGALYGAAEPVRLWLGLRDEGGDFDTGGSSLAVENDTGKSFAEIADLIESEPPGLFVEA
jgi:hypothetical protein